MANREWNGERDLAAIRLEAAKHLLAAAVFWQSTHKAKLSVDNPRPYTTPSRRGEYPRARSGWLQGHTLYAPATPEQVIANSMRVVAGYGANAAYGLMLQHRLGRLGIMDTLKLVRPQMATFAVTGNYRSSGG